MAGEEVNEGGNEKSAVDEGATLGNRPILAKIALGAGFLGLILPLGAKLDRGVCIALTDITIDAVEAAMAGEYGFVEPGAMPKLKDEIIAAARRNPRELWFQSAIPLRRNTTDRNHYWRESNQETWAMEELGSFQNMRMSHDCDHIMLIVRERKQHAA